MFLRFFPTEETFAQQFCEIVPANTYSMVQLQCFLLMYIDSAASCFDHLSMLEVIAKTTTTTTSTTTTTPTTEKTATTTIENKHGDEDVEDKEDNDDNDDKEDKANQTKQMSTYHGIPPFPNILF